MSKRILDINEMMKKKKINGYANQKLVERNTEEEYIEKIEDVLNDDFGDYDDTECPSDIRLHHGFKELEFGYLYTVLKGSSDNMIQSGDCVYLDKDGTLCIASKGLWIPLSQMTDENSDFVTCNNPFFCIDDMQDDFVNFHSAGKAKIADEDEIYAKCMFIGLLKNDPETNEKFESLGIDLKCLLIEGHDDNYVLSDGQIRGIDVQIEVDKEELFRRKSQEAKYQQFLRTEETDDPVSLFFYFDEREDSLKRIEDLEKEIVFLNTLS